MQAAVVTCHIPQTVEAGIKDMITFTSRGIDTTMQSAMLTVTSPGVQTIVNLSICDTTTDSLFKLILFVCRIVDRLTFGGHLAVAVKDASTMDIVPAPFGLLRFPQAIVSLVSCEFSHSREDCSCAVRSSQAQHKKSKQLIRHRVVRHVSQSPATMWPAINAQSTSMCQIFILDRPKSQQ